MTAPVFINGQGGSVTVASTTIVVVSHNVKADCEVLDTTNTGSGGWQENINGIKKVEGSLKMNFDTANDQADTITPGTTGTVTLPLGSSGKSFSGTARFSSVNVENSARGVVTYNCDFVSTGVWTLPT